jgi:hypothetical protein
MITLKVCDTTGRKVTFLDVEESLIGPIPFARLRELLQTDLGPDFTFAYVAPGKTKSMALARNVEDDYDFNISSNATILVMPASAPANVVRRVIDNLCAATNARRATTSSCCCTTADDACTCEYEH